MKHTKFKKENLQKSNSINPLYALE